MGTVSADIQGRLSELETLQEQVKHSEKVVLTGHDYNNILDFFKKTSDLRRAESDFREYAVSEVETCRARIESSKETAKMMREDMADLEEKLMSLGGAISDELGYDEFVTEQLQEEQIEMKRDLLRLQAIMDSYIEAEEDRSEAGGGTAKLSLCARPRRAIWG